MVDDDLNTHLGLPKGHRLKKEEAYDLYSYLLNLTGKDAGITPIVLMLYVDKNGDFTKMKTRRDSLVNQIFSNMDKGDQFTVLNYIDVVNGDQDQ